MGQPRNFPSPPQQQQQPSFMDQYGTDEGQITQESQNVPQYDEPQNLPQYEPAADYGQYPPQQQLGFDPGFAPNNPYGAAQPSVPPPATCALQYDHVNTVKLIGVVGQPPQVRQLVCFYFVHEGLLFCSVLCSLSHHHWGMLTPGTLDLDFWPCWNSGSSVARHGIESIRSD